MVRVPEEIPKPAPGNMPTKADMSHCPLCDKKFISYEQPGAEGKAYFMCLACEISIWVLDPVLGRWRNPEPEPCPMCQHRETRLFFRSDGYIKMVCPKCKYTIETVDPQKHDKIMAEEHARGVRFTPKPLPGDKNV
jgi:Zn ribbon nucleic-acid-binding protein